MLRNAMFVLAELTYMTTIYTLVHPEEKISEKNGFKVWLCQEHHEGTYGVHGKYGHELDLLLKQTCQKKFEETHTRSEFITLIGKNYIM